MIQNSSQVIRKARFYDKVAKTVLWICAGITAAVLIIIIAYIIIRGIASIDMDFLLKPPAKAGHEGGISTIIINTIFMILLTMSFSVPIGVGAAVYLEEYTVKSRLIRLISLGTNVLAFIPSIIFGLFGFIFFVNYLKLGIGLLSGTLTLSIMVLPTIIKTSQEAIRTVPMSYTEGSLALGSTKLDTIIKVVLPAAAPGIFSGIILSIGRTVGETAALLFTMGTDYRLADSLSSSTRVLSVHLYILAKEGISFDRAFATATVLMIIILITNIITNKLIERTNRSNG